MTLHVDCVTPLDQSAQLYGHKIALAWQKSVEGILEAGNLLIQAKAELSHGQFERMVTQECPFSARTARQLMQIAGHSVLGDMLKTARRADLPNSVTTLRELARFEPDELSHALGNHWIKTDMKPEEAKRLHRRVRQALGIVGRRMRARPKATERPGTDWLARLRKAWKHATEEERERFLVEIRGEPKADVGVEQVEEQHLHLVRGGEA